MESNSLRNYLYREAKLSSGELDIICSCFKEQELQKPDEVWTRFVSKLEIPDQSKVGLFATYKIRTGSMFRNMEKQIKLNNLSSCTRLKSRNGDLTGKNKVELDEYISAS